MHPLNGLQSRFQGNNLNDNQFRTQNSLQASDANTTNGFLSNYLPPNVSRPDGNWEGTQNITRVSGVDLTNEYLDNYQITNPTVRFRDDVNADFYA